MSDKTLAERCYEHDRDTAHEELFEAVHSILGGEPIHGNCLRADFQFKAVDTWTDYYDDSVEVILGVDVPPMTREQADKIIALGFGQVYESPTGIQWTKTYSGKVSPKEAHGDRANEVRLRNRVAVLEGERDGYRSAYAALLYDEQLANGEYVHAITCNASRKKPVGNDMCSCPIGRRVKP